jgi:hypothetical protein
MKPDYQNYSLFFRFIETFAPLSYKGIDPFHPLMVELEEMMEINNQFFIIGDLIKINYIFVSKRSTQIMGIDPGDLNPYHLSEAIAQDDQNRLGNIKSMIMKTGSDIFIAEKGKMIISSNHHIRNTQGSYSNILIQRFIFYSTVPYKSVFVIKVHTNIDWFKKIKNSFHFYAGDDLSYFKYPDEKMLSQGNIFSKREFEIITLIASGFESEQIAEKLFLSVHTVNTHRRNILEKSGKSRMSDLIYDLNDRGLL